MAVYSRVEFDWAVGPNGAFCSYQIWWQTSPDITKGSSSITAYLSCLGIEPAKINLLPVVLMGELHSNTD